MHVVIVGGGVIGLAVAWRSVELGLSVTVVDPEPASKASYVSAGMLPGSTPQLYDNEPLCRLYFASRDRYRTFAAEVEEASGLPVGFRNDGVLDVALSSDDLAELDRMRQFQEAWGIPTEALSRRECLDREPGLTPAVCGGILSPEDGSVDPRLLTRALQEGFRRRGGTMITNSAAGVLMNGHPVGVRLRDGGVVRCDKVVLAAGCWTHQLGGLPPGVVQQVRPVKGEIVRLRSATPTPSLAIRGLPGGSSAYLVPRTDGELVVGATYEDAGYDVTPTARGLETLLSMAREILPLSGALAFAEYSIGLRPNSADSQPLIGPTAIPDVLLATGHFRIGVQLAPITADVIAQMIVTGDQPEIAVPFTPTRFEP